MPERQQQSKNKRTNAVKTWVLGYLTIIDYCNGEYIGLRVRNTYGGDKSCLLYLQEKEGLNRFEFFEPLLQKYKRVYFREADGIKGYLPCLY